MGVRSIYTVERLPDLFTDAQKRFSSLGITAQMRLSDGTLGWSEYAPFDAIIVTAGSPDVPEALVQQLAVGGRLVVPVGSQAQQRLYRITRLHAGGGDDAFQAEEFQTFRFVPLLGEQGWSA
jgi:protein-L-isoaspartate(D-aspartate) O-methyltransferase